ncbi:MAG: ribose 5-phosphate isomerase B [Planctomycetes bacterium]|nr:ribose 5-phosphate isomerase B [Planctomycetota bacterium]
MRVAVACDHAGFPVKETVIERLRSLGHDVEDLGTNGPESVDYPDYAKRAAEAVRAGRCERAFLICGTGGGMVIAANKHAGIRATMPHDAYTARMARAHNDANVCCLGSRSLPIERIIEIIEIWMGTSFEGGRHGRRIAKIAKIEEIEKTSGGIPEPGACPPCGSE